MLPQPPQSLHPRLQLPLTLRARSLAYLGEAKTAFKTRHHISGGAQSSEEVKGRLGPDAGGFVLGRVGTGGGSSSSQLGVLHLEGMLCREDFSGVLESLETEEGL